MDIRYKLHFIHIGNDAISIWRWKLICKKKKKILKYFKIYILVRHNMCYNILIYSNKN